VNALGQQSANRIADHCTARGNCLSCDALAEFILT
jgi:hypothetical protein